MSVRELVYATQCHQNPIKDTYGNFNQLLSELV